MARENANRILLNKGAIYWNGETIADGVSATVTIQPTVTKSKSLGEITSSSRWAGVDYTVNVTSFRSRPYVKEYVKEFLKTGLAPEVTIQGIQDDEQSDYAQAYGKEVVTATGGIINGDVKALEINSESNDHFKDEISFNAKNINFS